MRLRDAEVGLAAGWRAAVFKLRMIQMVQLLLLVHTARGLGCEFERLPDISFRGDGDFDRITIDSKVMQNNKQRGVSGVVLYKLLSQLPYS